MSLTVFLNFQPVKSFCSDVLSRRQKTLNHFPNLSLSLYSTADSSPLFPKSWSRWVLQDPDLAVREHPNGALQCFCVQRAVEKDKWDGRRARAKRETLSWRQSEKKTKREKKESKETLVTQYTRITQFCSCSLDCLPASRQREKERERVAIDLTTHPMLSPGVNQHQLVVTN